MVIVPETVRVAPTEVLPVAVKVGAAVEPVAVPLATVPSIADPVGAVVAVAALDAVHVTAPPPVPLRLARAGTLGGEDHEAPKVFIRPLTVAVRGPQSAI